MANPDKSGESSPSQRLAAMRPDSGELAGRPERMKVRTKFIVADKTEVPAIIHSDVLTLFHVTLRPAFEGRSIHHGQVYVQGNEDNRIFGDNQPDAEITLKLHSKAIADTFVTGCAVIVDFTVDPGKDL